MLIEYENDTVRELFSDLNLMKRKVGNDWTKAIKKRIDQLKAASNFNIYLMTGLGRPHLLKENLKGYYGITITGNVRLIVKPVAKSLEAKDLQECDTVIIEGVVDYHGRKNQWVIP